MTIRIKLDQGAYVPEKSNLESEGLLLRASSNVILPPFGFATIDTGIHIGLPYGYYGILQSNGELTMSGVVSCGKVIGDLQSRIIVKLFNFSNKLYTFEQGDIIADLIIRQHGSSDRVTMEVEIIDEDEDLMLMRELFDELKKDGMLDEYDTLEELQEELWIEESRCSTTDRLLFDLLAELTSDEDSE